MFISVTRKRTYFFFRAEDGIRGWSVTGVQTCALRNCRPGFADCVREFRELANDAGGCGAPGTGDSGGPGRGPRPAHPENADRNALLHSPVGMQKCKSRSAPAPGSRTMSRSEEHTSELQSLTK